MHFMLGVVASTRTATSKIGYNEIILAAYIVCLQVAACVAIKLANNGEIWTSQDEGEDGPDYYPWHKKFHDYERRGKVQYFTYLLISMKSL